MLQAHLQADLDLEHRDAEPHKGQQQKGHQWKMALKHELGRQQAGQRDEWPADDLHDLVEKVLVALGTDEQTEYPLTE